MCDVLSERVPGSGVSPRPTLRRVLGPGKKIAQGFSFSHEHLMCSPEKGHCIFLFYFVKLRVIRRRVARSPGARLFCYALKSFDALFGYTGSMP